MWGVTRVDELKLLSFYLWGLFSLLALLTLPHLALDQIIGQRGGNWGWGWGGLTLRACKAWHSTQNNGGRHSWVGRGGTHQGLRVLFLGATDTGEDDLALTPTYFLCPSGSLALGRMLAIHFKFRHMLGVSATAGATLGWQNTRESNGNEENYQSTWGKQWGNCSGNPKWPKNTFERPD